MINIVHITDLHFGSAHNDMIDTKPEATYLAPFFKDSPSNYLSKGLSSLNPHADLLLMSGDYLTGKDVRTDYSLTQNLLSDLAIRQKEHFNFEKITCDIADRILITPGNHDVLRGESDPLSNFKNAFSNYMNPFSEPNPISEYRKFAPLFYFEDIKLIIYCLSTVDTCGIEDINIKNVLDLLNNIYQKNDSCDYSDEIKKQMATLEKRLYPDAPSITTDILNQFTKKNEQLFKLKPQSETFTKIILSHHPLLPIREEKVELKSFSNVIGGANFSYYAAEKYGYKLFIHGHMHTQNVSLYQPSGLNRKVLLNIGTPSLAAKDTLNGIALIQIDNTRTNVNVNVTYRSFDPYHRSFTQKIASGSFNLKDSLSGPDRDYSEIKSYQNTLVDYELRTVISEGKIIKGGDLTRINPASYDCALGYKYKSKGSIYELSITGDGPSTLIIPPGETVIVSTAEEFDVPLDMVIHASPMSIWFKKGIIPQISNFVDPGFKGKFYFPVINSSKESVNISVNESILSIEIQKLPKQVSKGWYEFHGGERNDFK